MGADAELRYLDALGKLEQKNRMLEAEIRELRGISAEAEERCIKEPGDRWRAHVRIKGEDSMAQIHIDGRRVNGVIGYRVEQCAGETPDPVLTLQVRCDLDLDCPAIPLLPEPWTWVYKPKAEEFAGRYGFNSPEVESGTREPTG